ncbi:hypothetical protein ASE23_11945 [Rhizobium sp. Root73]|uniref:hypothetical protein n=1 Tax=unclassified Rhizobium TaxID=2613769 RepID=UPI00071420EC|nr:MULTISPECIES: hypothetical protein [unclassified Rhizobium]KQV29028.1 hypothetical protein ASC96_13605 [Rhizobium sp. Root1204]KQY03522.1 hypothetical protein ASD36_14135 [Rhizobium sp. Root1334]KRC00170.1 hypothetical protein ASE23_11945 [Rhizobium sp. Root73]
MQAFEKTKAEHQHELRLAVVFGCILFPVGYLTASLMTYGWGWTAGLAELISAIGFGTSGIIVGSAIGGKMDRASEKQASMTQSKPSSTGREHSNW